MSSGGWAYAIAFCVSLALALVLTPLALRTATARGIFDHPGSYKTQESPIPYLGGVAIVLAFCLTVLGGASLDPPSGGFTPLVVIIATAAALSIVGLIDDLKGLGPSVRFIAQVAAAIAVHATGVGVEIFDQDAFNIALTLIWIVGITNAFNLLDNMDGLSGGVAAIAAVSFFTIAAVNGQFLVGALAAALVGCAIGFLRHNIHPARIYMGDAGSLFLGFMLAVIGLKLRFDGPTYVTFLVPIIVLGVPIMDTTLVTATRLMHHRNPLSGGRDHISHRLVFVGIPVRAAVSLIYASAVALGWVALVTSRIDTTSAFLLAGLVVGVALFLLILLARVPVYETSRRKHVMLKEVSDHEETTL